MKPMLAAKTSMKHIQYPCAASPKLDGIRCIIKDNQVLSRTGKLIPNEYVQDLFGRYDLNGLDGELIVGHPTDKDVYRNTNSGVMSIKGEPEVYFHVFDIYDEPEMPFIKRQFQIEFLSENLEPPWVERVRVVPQNLIANAEVLEVYEREVLKLGYEGVMVRDIKGLYKHGRSTANEFGLMKIKRFQDGEAIITGFEEMCHNDNELKYNAIGQVDRSLAKDGMRLAGVLGALVVRDLKTQKEFRIGTGFNSSQRLQLWEHKKELFKKIVKYKFLEYGVKDLPRHPVFLGFREEIDL